jgi:hypothetical protein
MAQRIILPASLFAAGAKAAAAVLSDIRYAVYQTESRHGHTLEYKLSDAVAYLNGVGRIRRRILHNHTNLVPIAGVDGAR